MWMCLLKSAMFQRARKSLREIRDINGTVVLGHREVRHTHKNWHRLKLLSDSFLNTSDVNSSLNKYCVTRGHQRLKKKPNTNSKIGFDNSEWFKIGIDSYVPERIQDTGCSKRGRNKARPHCCLWNRICHFGLDETFRVDSWCKFLQVEAANCSPKPAAQWPQVLPLSPASHRCWISLRTAGNLFPRYGKEPWLATSVSPLSEPPPERICSIQPHYILGAPWGRAAAVSCWPTRKGEGKQDKRDARDALLRALSNNTELKRQSGRIRKLPWILHSAYVLIIHTNLGPIRLVCVYPVSHGTTTAPKAITSDYGT